MIDPAFKNINRFFAVSFKNGNNDPTGDSFDKYKIPSVEIKGFNALIDNTTGNLLGYLNHQNLL